MKHLSENKISSISFGLPPDFREEKSRQQAQFIARARSDRSAAMSAMAFVGMKASIVYDPYVVPVEMIHGY